MTHPRMLLTRDSDSPLQTVKGLVEATRMPGVSQQLWRGILQRAEANWSTEPIHVYTPLEGRSPADLRRGNREYIVVDAAGQRLLCSALAALVTEDERHVAAATAQLECLFDQQMWPEWQDIFHREKFGFDADLRTGQLSRDVALAYDWLHPFLTGDQRRRVVEGLDQRGIQPFLSAVKAGAWWVERMNNWTTVIVGGLGICGMALHNEHPQAQQLVDLATGAMRAYMDHYGPEGEFNENPAYANSSYLPVLYFHALRSHEQAIEISPEIAALHRHCLWCMYATAPPGFLVSFGDCAGGRYPALTAFFPAVAAATRDPVLQWFYETYGTESPSFPIWELLWYDPTLSAAAPTLDRLPLGRQFAGHSQLISSRTDWRPTMTASVVFGKAGTGKVNHSHPDGGQIEILGHTRPLIIDIGSVPYPAEAKERYYHFSSEGHNQLTIGGRGQYFDLEHEARCTASAFDSARGGWWRIDLTELHEGVQVMTRTVVHLLPDIVAVLDEVQLLQPEPIRLRWHPGAEPVLGDAGRFTVTVEEVTLQALVTSVGSASSELALSHHQYVAPYDEDRIGNPMPQRHEPYLDLRIEGRWARCLSLFAIGSPGQHPPAWQIPESPVEEGQPVSDPVSQTWSWQESAGQVDVTLTEDQLRVAGPQGEWQIALPDELA